MCKGCVCSFRKLKRLASAQQCESWLNELKTSQSKTYNKLRKDFEKHAASGAVAKFSLLTWKKTLTLAHGSRASGRAKMMWENEFIEHKNTTAEGNVPRHEAISLWKQLEADPQVRRDFKGPRGNLRLRVALGDYDSDFDEMQEADIIEGEAKRKKQATETDMQSFISRARSSESLLEKEGEVEGAQSQLQKDWHAALGAAGAGQALASGAFTAVQLKELSQGRGKSKGGNDAPTANASTGEGEDDGTEAAVAKKSKAPEACCLHEPFSQS